jgi:hypothetical protein
MTNDFWKDYEPEPHKGLSEHLAQVTNGRVWIDPVTGDVGIGTAPVQEPFCFYYVENGEEYFAPKGAYVPDNAQPLYTTPPAQPAPVQEPAFYRHEDGHLMTPNRAKFLGLDLDDLQALYTTPPGGRQSEDCLTAAKREWTGLTDEEKQEWVEAMPDEPKPRHIMNLINVIEVELKGRNT